MVITIKKEKFFKILLNIGYYDEKLFRITNLINGALAGLAGVTAISGYADSYYILITGSIVGITTYKTSGFIKDNMKVDDVLDIFNL